MKISFPKYGIGELLTQKRLATCIISFVGLAVFAGALGSYLLGNKLWLLTVAVLGIACILLCLGAAAAIFRNPGEIDGAPSAPIRENVPRITSQWDYRPRKAIRASTVFDSPGAETSEVLSSDSFGINNNVWCNDNSLEGAAAAFINPQPDGEELRMKVLSEPTDTVCPAPTADDVAVSR